MDYTFADPELESRDTEPSGPSEPSGKAEHRTDHPLSVASWLSHDIEPPDFLLGELFSTTSRLMLIGPTGLGKTMFALEIAFALALGRPFLHWRAGRPCRVLYIDGEMPQRLVKDRLAELVKRWGTMPDTLFILSRDAVANMPPLNTPPGREFVEKHIADLGGVDCIIFDNAQALLSGNHRESEAWEGIKPWIRELTRRRIGQLWIHHTGHNEDHGYGDKTREWEMSTVMLMKRGGPSEADVAFNLDFTKTRERTPGNRADFEPRLVVLENDQWRQERAKSERGESQRDKLLNLIDQQRLIPHPGDAAIPGEAKCRLLQDVRKAWIEAETKAKPAHRPASHATSFNRALGKAEDAGLAGHKDAWIWINERQVHPTPTHP